ARALPCDLRRVQGLPAVVRRGHTVRAARHRRDGHRADARSHRHRVLRPGGHAGHPAGGGRRQGRPGRGGPGGLRGPAGGQGSCGRRVDEEQGAGRVRPGPARDREGGRAGPDDRAGRRPAGPRSVNLTVIGTGYLGAVHAACLAELGFEVLGTDIDPERIAVLSQGRAPFREPGLDRLLRRGLRSGRLRFTTSLPQAARFGDVHFLCVGTPQRDGHPGADLSQLHACVDALAPLLRRPCLVAGKSTVPVGTAAALAGRLAARAPVGPEAELAWNPEFLREGHAVEDTLRPARLVAGVRSARAEAVLREVYRPLTEAGTPLLVTDLATAELAKASANAFLATKISFVNAMAEVCEAAGADVTVLADVLGRDPRIGADGLRPGLGFGGGCLPKDLRALRHRAEELGARSSLSFLRDVDAINLRCRSRAIEAAGELVGGSLE